jgi:hypothetical protein
MDEVYGFRFKQRFDNFFKVVKSENALAIEADTGRSMGSGQAAIKALCSMSGKHGPQATP